MLLNFLWFGLILLAFASDLLSGTPFVSGMAGLSGARAGLELALTLAGPVCLWSGVSQAMERAGLTERLCAALRPMLRRLFPVCAADAGAVRRSESVGRDVPAGRDEYGVFTADPVDGRGRPRATGRGARI